MKSRIQIEYKELHNLIPYENNAKLHPIKQLEGIAESISKYGFLIPILVDANNVIVAGHARYEAASVLGINEAPCIVADNLSPQQIDEFRVLDNLLAESGHDIGKLQAEIGRLNLDLKPFKLELKPLKIDIKDIDNSPKKLSEVLKGTVMMGDTWRLGEHQIIVGHKGMHHVDALINMWQEMTGEEAYLESNGAKFDDLKKFDEEHFTRQSNG